MNTKLITQLSYRTGLQYADIEHIINTGPRRYKVYSIPKRHGGARIVAQPSRELKLLQRLVVSDVLCSLPVHDAAHGYVVGRSIKTNAQMHRLNNYLLKMDFSDFFPSLRPRDLSRHLKKYAPNLLDPDELKELHNMLFWRPKGQRSLRLCIGAPSSPFISNTLMYELDTLFAEYAASLNVTYTRYADDLTFSCLEKGILSRIENAVRENVRKCRSPKLLLNSGKTVHVSGAQRRAVTGIVISATGSLSLGRDRKRLIRAMVHRFCSNSLAHDEILHLRGLLAFAHDIEPSFAAQMRARMLRKEG